MRLTNSDRRAFVRAVMADVPVIDYGIQVFNLVKPLVLATLPKEVIAMWNNNKLKGYIQTEIPEGISYKLTATTNFRLPVSDWKPSEEIKAKLEELGDLYDQQKENNWKLETKLEGTIAGINTLKRALELLPEFAKYLPADRSNSVGNVPMIADVVVELTKAGWPKDKPKKIVPTKEIPTKASKKISINQS